MKKKNLRPKKRLGQNFLYDPAIAEKILSATGLGHGDVVVELGPGRGILTRPLAERGARVIALELDAALFQELGEEFDARPNVEVVNVDFTKVRLQKLLSDRGLERCALVGNIPYYLTREVLFDFLVDERDWIDAAYIMLQKEVGDRIASPPGSRVYGITSVVLQSLYDVKVVARVAPGSFMPPPKVASVVLGFTRPAQPFLERDELGPFKGLVKNLFQQRRKTIQNSLRSFYPLSEAALRTITETTGIDLGRRPETLSKEAFLELSRSVQEVTSS